MLLDEEEPTDSSNLAAHRKMPGASMLTAEEPIMLSHLDDDEFAMYSNNK